MNEEERIKLLNKLFKLRNIKRTGYVKRNVENPENVAEHSGSCALIAFELLPFGKLPPELSEQSSDNYDKMLIIELLIFHDMAEIDIGDIVRGTKTDEQKQAEYNSMKSIFEGVYDGVYNSIEKGKRMLELWKDFDSGNPKDINAKIAKEIDYIQGSYKYFTYCASNRVKYTKSDCIEWLNEVSDEKIKTKIGRIIRQIMINECEDFKKIKPLQEAIAELNMFQPE